MNIKEMLKEIQSSKAEGISAEYKCYVDFDWERILEKLEEYWKTIDDIEDAFIKRGILKVKFKDEDDYIDLVEWAEPDWEYKRPEDIFTY